MLAPSEVQGEVDHSFFDSDDGGGSVSSEKQRLQETQAALSLRENGTRQAEVKQVNRSRGDGRDRSLHQPRDQDARSQSSASKSHGLNNSSDSEDERQAPYKRPSKTLMALLDEANDGDMSTQSPNETEEEAALTKHLRRRSKQSPKKVQRKWRNHSPSRTSTEEADSESCSAAGGTARSTAPHKPRRSSLPPRERRPRGGSAGSAELPTSRTEESDDTLTDVSPPSSPDISPLQPSNPKVAEEGGGLRGGAQQPQPQPQQPQLCVPSSGLRETRRTEDSDQDMDESAGSISQGVRQLSAFSGRKNRKNFSFSNTEVRRIDLENQRLLRALSRLSVEPRPESAAKKKAHRSSNPPPVSVTSSTVNRQREQKRIDSQNMALLKRLESVKPSQGMKRSDQLADYQRLASYLGGTDCPEKESSCRRTSSAPGPRSGSSAHLGSREALASGSASASSSKQSGCSSR